MLTTAMEEESLLCASTHVKRKRKKKTREARSGSSRGSTTDG
jgi:hypothetical protein